MGKFSSYIKYWWKAKGRHGTHSPFVYAFVEDVLHDKRNFYCTEFIRRESRAQQLDMALSLFLFKTIHFLQPGTVALLGNTGKYSAIVKAAGEKIAVDISQSLSGLDKSKTVIVVDAASAASAGMGQLLKETGTFSIIILHPHRQESLWQTALAHANVLMSLDCWKAGLLLHNESFRIKQHFYLK